MSNVILVNVNKCSKSFEIDFAALPPASQQHIIEYGMKQKFNDCHSQFKDPAEAWAMVEKTKAALESGAIRLNRSTGVSLTEDEAALVWFLAGKLAGDDGKKLTKAQLVEVVQKQTAEGMFERLEAKGIKEDAIKTAYAKELAFKAEKRALNNLEIDLD